MQHRGISWQRPALLHLGRFATQSCETCLQPAPNGQSRTIANRRLVGTSIATVSEEASGILSRDTIESGSKCLLQSLDGARGDPAQIGFHLGPTGFDRAQVRTVAGQVAIGEA